MVISVEDSIDGDLRSARGLCEYLVLVWGSDDVADTVVSELSADWCCYVEVEVCSMPDCSESEVWTSCECPVGGLDDFELCSKGTEVESTVSCEEAGYV